MRLNRFVFAALALCSVALHGTAQQASEVDDALRDRSIEILRTVMADEAEWVKVHAAEHLLILGYKQGVQEAFEGELQVHGEKPEYRIGIWRVLAKAADSNEEKQPWLDKIRAAYVDQDGPDRLHASETLAKFPYVPNTEEIAVLTQDTKSEDGCLAAFSACLLTHAGLSGQEKTGSSRNLVGSFWF